LIVAALILSTFIQINVICIIIGCAIIGVLFEISLRGEDSYGNDHTPD
jgi:hypothetical protein